MMVKDMVLQDLPGLYPGLTRAGIEYVLRALDDQPLGHGWGLASELVAIAPVIAQRLTALSEQQLDDYRRLMRSAATLVLQMWTSTEKAPSPAAIVSRVEAL